MKIEGNRTILTEVIIQVLSENLDKLSQFELVRVGTKFDAQTLKLTKIVNFEDKTLFFFQ